MNKAQELRNLSEEFSSKSKEEVNDSIIQDIINCLMYRITIVAKCEGSSIMLTYQEQDHYRLHEDWIRKKIMTKFKEEGFKITKGYSGPIAQVDFIRISWE